MARTRRVNMRKYLYVMACGGGVDVSEMSENGAVETLGGTGALQRLQSAKNGDHFVAWYGEAEIIVLVEGGTQKVSPLINKDFNEQDLQKIDTCNDDYGEVSLSGWVAEDGAVMYLDEQPTYHPFTGDLFTEQ
jgi:hypothetical protein